MMKLPLVCALTLISFAGPALLAQSSSPPRDVAETVLAGNHFKTLSKALRGAELFNTLKGPGPFTLFAPTDDAFGKLPRGALDRLLSHPTQMKRVLLYHVVPGKHSSEQVKKMSSAKTLEGGTLHIRDTGTKIMINDAALSNPDIECTNGVIHVIDSVLMPK